MSTSICDAFRLPMILASEVRQFLESFRARATPVYEDLLADRMATLAVKNIDRRACGLSPVWKIGGDGQDKPSFSRHEMPISHSYDAVRHRMKRVLETKHRDPEFDLECSLVLMPHVDGHAYVMAFTEQREYINVLRAVPGIEDFSYWDGTDPPETIAHADWKKRGATWDEVMPSGVPFQHGWSMDLVGPSPIHYPTVAAVLTKVPPLYERVWFITRNLAFNAFAKAIEARDGTGRDTEDEQMSRAVERMLEFEDWRRTDGSAYVAQVSAIVAARLRPEITEDDLRAWGAERPRVSQDVPPITPDLIGAGDDPASRPTL